jgi:porphyrinogen peroxidase
MLQRMFIGEPPRAYDRLLDFSTAMTGSTFFVPTAGMLEALAEPPADPAAAGADVPDDPPATASSSLGIGSLRDRT